MSLDRHAVRCSRGPLPGASAQAGLPFVPRPQTPTPRAATWRPPEPEHFDLDRAIRDDVRRRLGRGEVRLPGRRPGSTTFRELRGALPAPIRAIRQEGSAYDASLAAGPAHLIAVGNYNVAVYRKSDGAAVLTTDLVHWFPNTPDAADVFDPHVLYDQHERRWILLAVAKVGPIPPRESYLLLSVSQGDDPLGQWWSWVFDARLAGSTLPEPKAWADYPCLGVDATAVFVSLNMFNVPEKPAKLRIVPKDQLYRGGVAAFVDFVDLVNEGQTGSLAPAMAVQPCHTYGARGPEYLVNTLTFGDTVTLWRAEHDAAGWGLTCESVTVDEYVYPTQDAPQKGEPKRLGVGGPRVRSAVCRDGAVWFSFATGYGAQGPDGLDEFTAARWEKIVDGRRVGGDEIGEGGSWYVFPSVMADRNGRVTMAVSRTSSGQHPAFCAAVWSGTGPPALHDVAPGAGPHRRCRQQMDCDDEHAVNGWGDYNAATLDPGDETTVWLYGGAGAEGDAMVWDTWIARVPSTGPGAGAPGPRASSTC